ncbi:MAG: AAA family ATPase [Pseudohongiella sp.]|nr:AAA family ATPase [Pseudohongiella sp.]
MTTAEAERFADPDWIVPGLIVQGHLHIIAAEPNGGKTTVFFYLAGCMVQAGFNVIYVNADISAGDAKSMVQQANQTGVKLLLPEMKAGKSMDDIVRNLVTLNDSGADLGRYIFIFDTLKKMTDVINKSASKRLLKLLRSMTAKGATVICLAHTNKYNGQDGKPIYEGTGDIKSDVDNLIYLIPDKRPDGSMLVSAEPDKQRAALEKVTFEISPQRKVKRLDEYHDIAAEKQRMTQRERDQDIIERITEAIQAKHIKQSDIVSYCKEADISRRQTLNCLKRYENGSGRLWKATPGFEKNARFYELA